MPILNEGENIIPTMHVKDLAGYIAKVAEAPPEDKKYLLAFDKSKKNMQKEILTSLAYNIGPRVVSNLDEHDLFTKSFKEILEINLKMKQSAPLSNEEEDEPADGSSDFEWYAMVEIFII